MEKMMNELIATCSMCGLDFEETEINMVDYELDLCKSCENEYNKKENIQFLKDLQQELRLQDTDVQAAPRFWVVGDYRLVSCPEGFEDSIHVNLPNRDYAENLEDLLQLIHKDEFEELSKEVQEEFKKIECDITAINWIKKHYDEDAYLIPVKEEHFIRPNTMFLTKAEAKKHIELNYYHYSARAHTYAMTAWRAPIVERLLKILETIDWDSISAVKNNG